MTKPQTTEHLDYLDGADRIASHDFYHASDIDILLENRLPKDSGLIPAELSDPRHAKLLEEIFKGLADPRSVKAELESRGLTAPDYKQVVFPVFLENGHVAGIHISEDRKVTYFDPIGLNSDITTETFTDLERSSIPSHIVEALEAGYGISRDDIAITTNKIQGTFIKDGQSRSYGADSGALTSHVLTEIAYGNIKVANIDGAAELTEKFGDEFHPIGDLEPLDAEKFTIERRKADLAEFKEIFKEKFSDHADEIDEIEVKEEQETVKKEAVVKEKSASKSKSSAPKPNPLSFRSIAGNLLSGLVVLAGLTSGGAHQINNPSSSLLVAGGANRNNSKGFNLTEGIDLDFHNTTENPPQFKGLRGFQPQNIPPIVTARPSPEPTPKPSVRPTSQPTGRPSGQPTQEPTSPTGQPTGKPFGSPSSQPSRQPTSRPSQPSSQPSASPTGVDQYVPGFERWQISLATGAAAGIMIEGALLAATDGGSLVMSLVELAQRNIIAATAAVVVPSGVTVGIGAAIGSGIKKQKSETTGKSEFSPTVDTGLEKYDGTQNSLDMEQIPDYGTYVNEGATDAGIGLAGLAAGILTAFAVASSISKCCGNNKYNPRVSSAGYQLPPSNFAGGGVNRYRI